MHLSTNEAALIITIMMSMVSMLVIIALNPSKYIIGIQSHEETKTAFTGDEERKLIATYNYNKGVN